MVGIDEVYKTVLNILNKESRGYITPKEFNSLAVQAQNEIFESYFYQIGRAKANYGNTAKLSNTAVHVMEKLSGFLKNETITDSTLPSDLYRLEAVLYSNRPVFEKNIVESGYLERSELTKGTEDSPYYTRLGNIITLYPEAGENIIKVQYYKKPIDPNWVGLTANGQIVASTSDDNYENFELHSSELPELVAKILSYSGIIIRAAEVTQVSLSKEQQIKQSEQ